MSRIYGLHAVENLLDKNPEALSAIIVAEGHDDQYSTVLSRARAHGIRIAHASVEELRRRSGGRKAVGLGADVRLAAVPALDELRPDEQSGGFVLALDGVTDPHNLGAILRTAGAFGAQAVIVAKDRSAPLNDAAIRASAGAVAQIPVLRVVNLSRALRQLKEQGYWIFASSIESAPPIWDVDLTVPLVLVLGSEGEGMRPGVKKSCDMAISLPLPGFPNALNVSVFAGVACAEVSRQRLGLTHA